MLSLSLRRGVHEAIRHSDRPVRKVQHQRASRCAGGAGRSECANLHNLPRKPWCGAAALIPAEADLVSQMQTALAGRPIADYRQLARPHVLPSELVFNEGDSVPTRKATEAWFAWAMKNSAFLDRKSTRL